MRIALVYAYDTRDKQTSSGIPYYTSVALEKYCGKVVHFSPIPCSKEVLVGRAIRKASRLLFQKNFPYHRSFLLAKRFARFLEQRLVGQSFDVIMAIDAAEIAFLKTDIPIVLMEDVTYHLLFDYYATYSNLTKRSIYEMNTIQSLALNKVSAAIYTSFWAARSAIEDYGIDAAKVHVVPFGANLEEIPGRESVLARKKSPRCRLLFLASEWIRKGGDIAFETLLKLDEMGIPAELIVCGCVPPNNISHDRMKVIPFLDKNDQKQREILSQIMLNADFLILPTRADCTPISFSEAAAFALPVITTNIGGIADIIHDGENGYMLPGEARGDAYAEIIKKIYYDDKHYMHLVHRSRAIFEERLNWDVSGRALQQILSVVSRQGSLATVTDSI